MGLHPKFNKVIRKRHCGPVSGECPEHALRNLAGWLAEIQPYFVCYPRIDYFNILFAPLVGELGEGKLRACLRRFLHLLCQLHLSCNARESFQLDVYAYVPSHVASLGIDEIFAPLTTSPRDATYKDLYRESLVFAKILLEELQSCPHAQEAFSVNAHFTRFFEEDDSEQGLLEHSYRCRSDGLLTTFMFEPDNGGADDRMELLRGGDIEFHRVSVNLARIFFDVPLKGTAGMMERFKAVFASALCSGIEKLDFLASLMRRPGQILWGLGKRADTGAVFDVLNSHMSICFSGIEEARQWAQKRDIDVASVLDELTSIAADIADSKGEENLREVDAESIVVAMDLAPSDNTLAEDLQGKVKEIYKIGDAVSFGRIKQAVNEGFTTAYNL